MVKNSKNQHATKKLLTWSQSFQILIFLVFLMFLPQQNLYAFRALTENVAKYKTLIAPTPIPIPIKTTNNPPPELTASGVIVIDVPSKMVMHEVNAQMKLLPASTTKIMTALVAMSNYKMDDVITVKTVITEGQVMHLVRGEKITVENLLYGILVHSANDAAFALAEHHTGGVEGFVTEMNETAAKLELTNTRYANPIGFDDPNQYTTPKDLAYLSIQALTHPLFAKIVAVPQITVSDTSFVHFHSLKNVNELLGKIPGVSGIKTGWTENAGQALVTTVDRDSHKILIVVLRSEDRFGETEALLNWTFDSFTWKSMEFPQ